MTDKKIIDLFDDVIIENDDPRVDDKLVTLKSEVEKIITNLQLQLEDRAYEQLKVSHKKLQQENKNLKIQLKGTTHCYDEEEHKRLQQENEKFRVYLKPKYIVDKIKKLEEENEKLRIDISARETVCNDYKSRNEKAKEYINFLQIDTPEGFVPFNKCIWGEELLELLQGSDNNE